jgi:multimeric flavodoxin WrbA/putative sterol carrier protein
MDIGPSIVVVNGSPHAAVGNTALMIEMLRSTLLQEGFQLEVIHLAQQRIEYCRGCAFCLEKGACWIDDDHRLIVKKLLSAPAVILASPVYFMQVTGQMKTFIDRCLALGHKPRPNWKPGLTICVSAGLGETRTAQYLAFLLRTFGAFPVGMLTAMATQPGQFWGQAAVEDRAVDLARDLARSIKENRRYPPTDQDLRYYQFMSNLVKGQKDIVMQDDYQHWQNHGLYDGFAAYIQQGTTEIPLNPGERDAWIKEMIAAQKEEKKVQPVAVQKPAPGAPSPTPQSCLDLLRSMPASFNAAEARGLRAIYQFEISDRENFIAHIRIADGKCTFQTGRAEKPDVVIKAPGDIWVKVSKGELSGQKAFLEGQYRVEGDMMLIRRMKNLFSTK